MMAAPGQICDGGHKMTGLADGEDDTDAVTVGQPTAALDALGAAARDLERGHRHDRGDDHACEAGRSRAAAGRPWPRAECHHHHADLRAGHDLPEHDRFLQCLLIKSSPNAQGRQRCRLTARPGRLSSPGPMAARVSSSLIPIPPGWYYRFTYAIRATVFLIG